MTTIITVINREDSQKEVNIVFTETGVKDSVFIQPFAKARLPEGAEVAPGFLALNKKVQVVTTPSAG